MKHSKLAVITIAFVLAALVLALSGCDIDGVKEYSDPSVLIEVEKGEEFAIVLESNPSTGYQWKLAEPLDEEILILMKTEFEEPDEDMPGAPGAEKWTFKAENLGATEITMAYVRPWEEETPEVMGAEEESTEAEAEAEGEEHAEEAEEGEEPELISEEEPTTMTFEVRVVKAGTEGKEPEEFENDEEPIEVEQNLEFIVVLESNPTTGYSWQLAQPLDEDILELMSNEFEEKKPEGEGEEGELVGAPGEEKWTFKAIGEGETEIDFEYVRPWETDVQPEDEKTFKVEVKPASEEEAEE